MKEVYDDITRVILQSRNKDPSYRSVIIELLTKLDVEIYYYYNSKQLKYFFNLINDKEVIYAFINMKHRIEKKRK